MEKGAFVAILRKEIKSAGYTQGGFADAIGVSLASLKKYLSTKIETLPDIDVLDQMCDKLNCDADYLLGRSRYKKGKEDSIREFTTKELLAEIERRCH